MAQLGKESQLPKPSSFCGCWRCSWAWLLEVLLVLLRRVFRGAGVASLCCVETLLGTFAFPECKRESAWQGSVSELPGFVCKPQGSPEF